jgi:hypothetical protein
MNVADVSMLCFNDNAHEMMAHMLMSCSYNAQMQGKHLGCYTYPMGSGYPYPYPHPPSLNLTRRVTRTRTRVGKCSYTRTRAGKFYPTGNPHPTTYPRITYKYQTFTCKK